MTPEGSPGMLTSISSELAGVVEQVAPSIVRVDDGSRLTAIETVEASQEWERSQEHRELTMPLRDCWDEAQRTSYEVRLETRRRQPDTEPAAIVKP